MALRLAKLRQGGQFASLTARSATLVRERTFPAVSTRTIEAGAPVLSARERPRREATRLFRWRTLALLRAMAVVRATHEPHGPHE